MAVKRVEKKYKNPAIKKIIKAQREFFNSGRTLDLSFRLDMLGKLKESILRNESEIYEALKSDLNKSEFESYMTELGPVLNELNTALKKLRKWAKPRRVPTPVFIQPGTSKIYREPYGVSLIISPWNYPFNLLMSPLIGSIAAGNTAILKTAPASENTSAIMKKIIDETFEENYISLFQGWNEVGASLLKERYDYIFFTGGGQFGRVIYKSAAENLTPVTLELGGKSPCVVAEDADVEIAARRIVWGKFINCGQTCVAPDYVLITKENKEKLMGAIIEEIKNSYGEDPISNEDYGRIISSAHYKRIMKFMKSGTIVFGGDHDGKKKYIGPTVLDNVKAADSVMKEEIFGPVLPFVTVHSIDEAIEFINERPKPLALYLFTKSGKTRDKVIYKTSSGGVCVNDVMLHLANEHLPFGGVGDSGIGSYHGLKSFVTFSHERSILEKSFFLDLKFRYFPSSLKKLAVIKKFIS